MIYFDNGATTFPKPQRVERAVMSAFTRYGANPGRAGHTISMATAQKVYECREAAAQLFHAEQPEDVVFCHNTTHAINLALKGVLRQGSHVIVSDLEHNAVLRPVHTLAQFGTIQYSVAKTFDDEEETVQSFASLIRSNTRLIACIHASNVFGIRLPIEKLGRLAREAGIFFLVDAAQTAGVLDIDAPALGIDFLCVAGHKSLYGPTGTGLLITPHGAGLRTIIEGGTGSFSADYNQPLTMPDRFESGTANVPGILGLGAGISFVREKTPASIYQNSMKLGKLIYDKLRQTKCVTLYAGDFTPGKRLPVISFNIDGLKSEETAAMLSDMGFALRAGLHCAPLAHQKMGTLEGGTVRISLGSFNTEKQCQLLCETIKKIASKHCNNINI